jgi:hypothetical protein
MVYLGRSRGRTREKPFLLGGPAGEQVIVIKAPAISSFVLKDPHRLRKPRN